MSGAASLHVAVVGGGIGGLTAAIALTRKGVGVTVYEQVPELAPIGASVALGPNATRLLDALGLAEGIRRVGVRAEAVELVRWDDGRVLLHTDLGAPAEEYFGAPALDFLRAELQDVLVEALPAGALRLGAQVERVEQRAERAELHLADGTRVEADAIVAADGMRSPIRQQLIGADEPVFSGTVVYRGLAPRGRVLDLYSEPINRFWIGPYRHGPVYWLSAGRVLAVNAGVQHADWAEESWTTEAPVAELLAYFEGWDGRLLELYRRCTTLLRSAVYVRRPLERWTFGRITLLGDAAHAMEPWQAQGAAQAIEDAYVLADCLADGDAVDGLERYERLRVDRANELQESSSRAANVFYLPDGEEQRRRDAEYETLPERLPWGHRQKLWEYDVRSSLS